MRLINADALKDVLKNWRRTIDPYDGYWNGFNTAFDKSIEAIDNAPTIEAEQPEPKWIPVKMRPMDSEEREYWEDQLGEKLENEDAVMFDCPMPEDGQEILVSYRKWVSMDRCEIDEGCYGLEGNGDWEGIIAWMPIPEPYREVEE